HSARLGGSGTRYRSPKSRDYWRPVTSGLGTNKRGGFGMSFGSRVRAARNAYGPLCVGIDPHPYLLEQWGYGDTVDGLAKFAGACVEAFAGRVAFVKPQSAFFERFGAKG